MKEQIKAALKKDFAGDNARAIRYALRIAQAGGEDAADYAAVAEELSAVTLPCPDCGGDMVSYNWMGFGGWECVPCGRRA